MNNKKTDYCVCESSPYDNSKQLAHKNSNLKETLKEKGIKHSLTIKAVLIEFQNGLCDINLCTWKGAWTIYTRTLSVLHTISRLQSHPGLYNVQRQCVDKMPSNNITNRFEPVGEVLWRNVCGIHELFIGFLVTSACRWVHATSCAIAFIISQIQQDSANLHLDRAWTALLRFCLELFLLLNTVN